MKLLLETQSPLRRQWHKKLVEITINVSLSMVQSNKKMRKNYRIHKDCGLIMIKSINYSVDLRIKKE